MFNFYIFINSQNKEWKNKKQNKTKWQYDQRLGALALEQWDFVSALQLWSGALPLVGISKSPTSAKMVSLAQEQRLLEV